MFPAFRDGGPFLGLLPFPIGGGAVASAALLRFAAPQYAPTREPALAKDATYLDVRGRTPFRIGSGDMTKLVLSFGGWCARDSAGNMVWQNMANGFNVVKYAIEKSGATSSVPVTFGGLRTKTIAAGDVDIQSDEILPTSFGLTKFTRGDLYYLRYEYGVTADTEYQPAGGISSATQGGPDVAVNVIPNTTGVSAVDSYGDLVYTTGWSGIVGFPYMPTILGVFETGDPKTLAGIGDSLMYGVEDTLAGYGVVGGFGQGSYDADHTSNPIAGLNFGITGTNAKIWGDAGAAAPKAMLQYAKYCVEEYGTNYFGGVGAANNPTTYALAQTGSQAIWAAAVAAGCEVVRVKLLQRTNGNNTTFLGPKWEAGGDARNFNDWIDTQVGLPDSPISVIDIPSLRASSDQSTDGFYQWTGTNTADYTHPNTAGSVLWGNDYRTAFSLLP